MHMFAYVPMLESSSTLFSIPVFLSVLLVTAPHKLAFAHLQNNPVSLFGSQLHGLFSYDLLALPQGDVVEVAVVISESQLLALSLHILQRVHARRQDKEDRGSRAGLLI